MGPTATTCSGAPTSSCVGRGFDSHSGLRKSPAPTTATCFQGSAVSSLRNPNLPGTYTVVAATTMSDQAMGMLVVNLPSTGPESATTIALIGGVALAAGLAMAGMTPRAGRRH